jgi:hypothetical protein
MNIRFVTGLVNLRMLDLSDSDVGNDGLRFLTGNSKLRIIYTTSHGFDCTKFMKLVTQLHAGKDSFSLHRFDRELWWIYTRFEEAGELEPFLHTTYHGQWAAHSCNYHFVNLSEP